MFQALRTWLDHRRFLREERSAEYQANYGLNRFFHDQIGLAQRTFKLGNREAALDIWRQMFVRFPYLSAASRDGIDLALDLGLYDEVEALLQEMQRRYPNYEAVFIAAGLARVAHHRGHPEEAVRRSKVLIKKYPTASQGYHLAATYLDGIGRHDEGDAIIARAVSKLPRDNSIMVRHANRAMRQHAWPEALRRWELIQRQFDNIIVPLSIAQCLRQMNCLAAAEKVLVEARADNKLNDAFFVELANLMTAKGDFDAAIGCWQDAIKWNPLSASAYINGAAAMRKIGREADADEFLRTAMNLCRADLSVHLAYARSADRRRDGVAAKERWAIVRDRFPDCAEARKQDAETIAVLGPGPAS